MDELVRQALLKWPNVPDCYGWLALDARGDYYMRDDGTQAAGAFGSCLAARGSRIEHVKLKAFIDRNYARTARGEWFFQNGPQRVYMALEAAPFVWRVPVDSSAIHLISHNEAICSAPEYYLDENGRVFAADSQQLGVVHTQDMHALASRFEEHAITPTEVTFAELLARFKVVLNPAPPQ
jgi:hypothetical protein